MNADENELPVVETAAPKEPLPSRPRRRWWRFFYQFSLRTLLIATTLAAIGCWWFLRPKTQEEDLAGKYLTLKRQVRIASEEPVQTNVGAEPELTVVNVGSWQIRGQHGDLLVSGRYQNNEQTGRWTTWHTNGHKAAEGEVVRGVRDGIWRVWDEAGTLRSEVTYRVIKQSVGIIHRARLVPNSVLPIVGAIGPLAQFGGGWATPPAAPAWPPPSFFVSQRHGPCRVWYASGVLHYEGQYQDDRREGLWTWYDEQGKLVQQGTFKADLREGKWLSRAENQLAGSKPAPGAPPIGAPGPGLVPAKDSVVVYVAGRTQDEHDALLTRLDGDLAGGNLRQQTAAAAALEALGPAGQPVLGKFLDDTSDNVKLLALRALVRQGELPAELLPQIEQLAEHPDERLSLRALVAIYQLEPARREVLFPRISEAIRSTRKEPLAVQSLQRICEVDPDRRPLAMLQLIERLAQRTEPADGYDRRFAYDNAWYVPEHVRPILAIEGDHLPVFEQAFGSTDPKVRLFVIQLLEMLIEQGPAIELPTGELRHEIPEAAKPLVERAKADRDPAVRAQAEAIGRPLVAIGGASPLGGGQPGMGGQGGGFF